MSTSLPGSSAVLRPSGSFRAEVKPTLSLEARSADSLCASGAAPYAGRFCCSMYWRTILSGAPPTDPAKYDPDHSRCARQ